MALDRSQYKDREFLAVIGDEDSVTGILLAGVGVSLLSSLGLLRYVEIEGPWSKELQSWKGWLGKQQDRIDVTETLHVTDPPDSQKNYLVVDAKTEDSTLEDAFDQFTTQRKDIAILLINQHIADRIRGRVDAYNEAFPSVLEIPSKDHPYDAEKDSVMKRVRKLFGE
nr:v-type proton atpase subunit f [Quercus suber]